MDLKQVTKNVNLLNGILIALSLVFAYDNLYPQSNAKLSFVLPPLKKKPVEKIQNEPPKVQIPSPMDYVAIADQNLFHPERRIPPEKKAEAALPKPEFILYGTLITPDLRMAYLEDKKAPVSTPGRGKRQSALKKGEFLSGYTVKEIMADKGVMTRGEESLTVLLDDQKTPKAREGSTITAASHPQMPGLPSTPPSTTAGQAPVHPTSSGMEALLPGGKLIPRTTPTGGGISMQPSSPGAIAPSSPGSPAVPLKIQRYLESRPQ